MRFFISLNIFLLLNVSLHSQSTSRNQVDKQLKDAALYFDNQDYLNALKEYRVVLKLDGKNEIANLNALICKIKMNYEIDSVMEYASRLKNSKLAEALYYLGIVNHKLKRFDEAIVFRIH